MAKTTSHLLYFALPPSTGRVMPGKSCNPKNKEKGKETEKGKENQKNLSIHRSFLAWKIFNGKIYVLSVLN